MKVSFSFEAKRDFLGLGPSDQIKIREKVKSLSSWPDLSGWKAMRNEWAGHGRLRAGDWRVIFRIPKVGDDILWVVRIGHRSVIYDD